MINEYEISALIEICINHRKIYGDSKEDFMQLVDNLWEFIDKYEKLVEWQKKECQERE